MKVRKNMVDLDGTSSALVEQISLYTMQLEEYDRLSANYMLICVGFVLVILLAVAFLLIKGTFNSQKISSKSDNNSGIIALLFLTIPMITVLYMYVFSMQCRKVAIYRGYLGYLEDQLSNNVSVPLFFDKDIVNEFMVGSIWPFSSVNFYTNGIGPIVMQGFILLIYGAACVMAIAFMLKFCSSTSNNRHKIFLKVFFIAIITISTLSIVPFVYDLVHNSVVMEGVYQYCLDVSSKK